jgi:hypothetical protein
VLDSFRFPIVLLQPIGNVALNISIIAVPPVVDHKVCGILLLLTIGYLYQT